MTQDDLKDWLEVYNCYVYKEKQKEDGIHYTMRSKVDKKLMAVVFPVRGGTYKAATVCAICNNLGVDVPDYGKSMQPIIDHAKKMAKDPNVTED